jgi:hypothetical protein
MLDVYLRGCEKGAKVPRAAQLVEALVDMAMRSENENVRLAAIKEILDRTEGKAKEIREVKTMKLEGIVYLPEPSGVRNADE